MTLELNDNELELIKQAVEVCWNEGQFGVHLDMENEDVFRLLDKLNFGQDHWIWIGIRR